MPNATFPATAPVLEIDPQYTPHLRLVNPDTGKPDDKVVISLGLKPVGFVGQATEKKPSFVQFTIDISPSMADPIDKRDPRQGKRIERAKEGALAFLDALSPDDYFSITKFDSGIARVYPTSSKPEKATPQNVAAARRAVQALSANGDGTKMAPTLDTFLTDALALGDKVGNCYLGALTDGQYGDPHMVAAALAKYKAAQAKGASITVLCFGIGVEWDVDQLKAITEATASNPPQLVLKAKQVNDAVKALASADNDMALTNVRLFIRKSPAVPIRRCLFSKPVKIDLAGFKTDDEQVTGFNLKAMDNEPKQILIELGVQMPGGASVLVACVFWIEYQYGKEKVKTTPTPVRITWTDDENLSSIIKRGVMEALGAEASAVVIRNAVKMAKGGNRGGGEKMVGDQYRIAFQNGDQDVMNKIAESFDIIDPANGVVRFKATDEATLIEMETGSEVIKRRTPPAA
jgi:hypothetical protein